MLHRGFISAVIVSGMVEEKEKQATGEKEGRKPWTLRELGGKTAWDWLQLLVVPLMLALITVVFAWQQDARQQRHENQRAKAERELAEQRAQDEALQAYLDQMSQLMLGRKLLEAEPGDPVYTLAQARTSTVILRLDAQHNESVTRFLSDSGLALSSKSSAGLLSEIALSHATLSGAYLPNADLEDADLSGANLSNADLNDANLTGADLSNTNLSNADLEEADLSEANLPNADLEEADLSNAFLPNADLSNAFLSNAFLSNAFLSNAFLSDANLPNADLNDANLSDADLNDANLNGADLSNAYLGNAFLPNADLEEADLSNAIGITAAELVIQGASLKGATLPNGQKYEDWRKDR